MGMKLTTIIARIWIIITVTFAVSMVLTDLNSMLTGGCSVSGYALAEMGMLNGLESVIRNLAAGGVTVGELFPHRWLSFYSAVVEAGMF